MSDRTPRRPQQSRRPAGGSGKRGLIQALIIIGAVIVVGGIIALVIALANQGSGEAATPEVDTTVAIGGNPAVPLMVDETALQVGDPDAPVVIDLFLDYSCPHCQEYEAIVGDTLLELAGSGEAVVRNHFIQIVTTYGARAGSTSMCVAAGQPEEWASVHAALFANHSAETDGWRTGEFRSFVSDLGVTDQSVLDCVQAGTYMDWIRANTTTALADGVQGTPTLRIDGEVTELLTADGLRAAVAERLTDAE